MIVILYCALGRFFPPFYFSVFFFCVFVSLSVCASSFLLRLILLLRVLSLLASSPFFSSVTLHHLPLSAFLRFASSVFQIICICSSRSFVLPPSRSFCFILFLSFSHLFIVLLLSLSFRAVSSSVCRPAVHPCRRALRFLAAMLSSSTPSLFGPTVVISISVVHFRLSSPRLCSPGFVAGCLAAAIALRSIDVLPFPLSDAGRPKWSFDFPSLSARQAATPLLRHHRLVAAIIWPLSSLLLAVCDCLASPSPFDCFTIPTAPAVRLCVSSVSVYVLCSCPVVAAA